MIIGLTGGIASGKSLVADEFRRLGAKVIDADVIAREVLQPGEEPYKMVVEEFGEEILAETGELDRAKLGEIVFNDCERLKRLNQLTHPEIIRRIEERVEEIVKNEPGQIIVLNAPLLIEVGLHTKMDRVVVVYADEERLVERIVSRDKLKKEDALKRLTCQMPLKEKIEYADHVIYNSSSK
ncbi:MAG: dephospho-CoA kinase, partial [Thermodesulfobacteriota bacterium]